MDLSHFSPEIKALLAQVRSARQQRQALRIVGQGTRSFLGGAGPGRPISTLALQGIISYQPAELFIRVRAGTALADIEDTLARRQQYLAFEPPRFALPKPGGGTAGGMVAAGLSGPGRMAGGSLREAVLGITVIDGRAQVLQFGGQVIKNVAGYDISRLFAGSLGTLGILLDVTLRVAPLPPAQQTRCFEMPQGQAIEQVNHWLGQAWPIHATAWHRGVLHVRFQGAAAAVRAAGTALGGAALDDDDAALWWQQLRDHEHSLLQGNHPLPLWRLAVPPTHPPLALTGQPLLEWHGGQRWLRTDLPANIVHAAAHQAGGHATRWRQGSSNGNPQAIPALALAGAAGQIERRLKQTFDPDGIFNPGRRVFAP